MELSVLIVSHGHGPMVRRCLDSLPGGLEGLDHEIIVVDNLSEPGFAAEIGAPRPGVTVLANPAPLGFGANVNRAAAAARGRMLLILNPDTAHLSGQVAEGIGWLDSHPETGVLAARLLNPDGSEQFNYRRFPVLAIAALRGFGADRWPWQPGFYRRAVLAPARTDGPFAADWVYGSFMLMPRAVFERMGGFDTCYFMYYEDVDLCWRLRRAGLGCVVHPGLSFLHDHIRTSARNPFGAQRRQHVRSLFLYLWRSGSFLRPPRFGAPT